MPDRARLGTVAAAVCVLLPFGPAVANAAPAETVLAQEQLRNMPPGLWGLLGLLGLFGLVGLTRRGPKRNAKNPLAGYSGEDELAQGRHQAPRGGSPMDILPGQNPQVERPPAAAMDGAHRQEAAAPMPDPRRPVSKTPADVPMPSYTSWPSSAENQPAPAHSSTGAAYGSGEIPGGPHYGDGRSAMFASGDMPAGAQPSYASGEMPAGAHSADGRSAAFTSGDMASGAQPGYGSSDSRSAAVTSGEMPAGTQPGYSSGDGRSTAFTSGEMPAAAQPGYASGEMASGESRSATSSSSDMPSSYAAADGTRPAYGSADGQPAGQSPASGDVPSAAQAWASTDAPSGAHPAPEIPSPAQPYAPARQPAYAAGEAQVASPMDVAPTAPTPAQYRRNPEPFPQTDQDPPPQQPAVPQQQGTFAGLPRYPETAAPEPGPLDTGPRHRR
ncbi:hypothetical protein ACFWQL_38435 [Amycolatopsis thermoflava]|uniref:hypothetical protein n=1 Tax=Amycolatopsis thermoflava TaxID=84480 RepID=UPI00365C6B97